MPDSKIELRRKLRALRAGLAAAARRKAAGAAASHLARALAARRATHVALYVSSGNELSTAPLLDALRARRIYVPKVGLKGFMRFVRLRPGLRLRANRYGIREPVAGERATRIDAIVAPLLAFDARGHRLGQGGGYYDRLLSRPRAFGRPLRIGYAYAAQEVSRLPVEAHDVRLDAVVTERGYRRFTGA